LALVVAAFPVSVRAQQAQPFPPEVRAYFDKARQECLGAGDKLHVDSDNSYAESADFNSDGHTDYIIHMAKLYCPSLGATEYCGSAGCMVTILVSAGDRLREILNENFQALAVTKPVDGKQNIVFGAHGTYCGHKSGADTCFGVMRWTPKGFKTTYTGSESAALKAQHGAGNAQAAEVRPDQNPKFDWKLVGPVTGKKGTMIAMSDGTPDRIKAVVGCAENAPVMILSFPAETSAPPVDEHVTIEIGEPGLNRTHADLVLQPVQDKTAYSGQLSRAALSVMQAADTEDYAMVAMAWTIRNRDYWTDLPYVPLAHFKETSNVALESCIARLR
jgi:hypothetical protein